MTQAMTRPSVFRKANVRKSSLLHNRYLCRHATLRGGALRDDKKKGRQRKSSLRSRCRFFRAKEEISSLLARPVKKKTGACRLTKVWILTRIGGGALPNRPCQKGRKNWCLRKTFILKTRTRQSLVSGNRVS